MRSQTVSVGGPVVWVGLLLLFTPAFSLGQTQTYVTTIVAGSKNVGDGGAATQALLIDAEGVTLDYAGSIYVSDAADHRIRSIGPDGAIQTIAGTGVAGFSGDGGPAAAAQLRNPYGLAYFAGTLYIADLGNGRVRKVGPDGRITTVAGGGSVPPGGNGDGGMATDALLALPRNVTFDGAGNLYISDFWTNCVYQVTPAGTLTTLAGNGTQGYSGDGGAAQLAQLNAPAGLAADASNAVYVVDSGNHCIRKIANGQISTVTSQGMQLPLLVPAGMAIDRLGNLFIADDAAGQILELMPDGELISIPLAARDVAADTIGNLYGAAGPYLSKVGLSGAITTVAGTGPGQFLGEGTPAAEARLYGPSGVAADGQGGFYIADTINNRVRYVSPAGLISTVAGPNDLNSPSSIAVDSTGSVFIADTGNHRIRKRATDGSVLPYAGTGSPGYSGDGGPAGQAQFNGPSYVTIDPAGNLYIADTGNQCVRKVDSDGNITTVVSGLAAPRGLAIDGAGNLYIADTGGGRVVQLSNGVAAVIPGEWISPQGLARDAAGNLYVADSGSNMIVQIAPSGAAATVTSDTMAAPYDVAVDSAGAIYVADYAINRIRKLTPQGVAVVPPDPVTQLALVNAASSQGGPVAPGEIVSIYGSGFGGAGVSFDGKPAPLFYSGDTQINAQVPYEVAGQESTQLQIGAQAPVAVPVGVAAPGLFPVAVNQDGTVNSVSNAAGLGSIVTLYATGEGQTNPPGATGKLTQAPWPAPLLSVSVLIGGFAAVILFAGEAPELTGVMQVNARIPGGYIASGSQPVSMTVGGVESNTVRMFVK